MRQSIIDYFGETVIYKYSLRNENLDIDKSIYSTINDQCYKLESDSDLAKLIYKALLDYAFDECEMNGEDINNLHLEAITQRMRIEEEDDDETQGKYGFFGEVLLNLFLRIKYGTECIITKGVFYDILKPEELKGYDSFHLVEDEDSLYLWFGEVKFHQTDDSAIKSALDNLEKAISDDYFRKNLLALTPKKRIFNAQSTKMDEIIARVRKDPKIQISALTSDFNVKLIYPIFIISNTLKDYDKTIKSSIKHISKNYSGKKLNIGIDYDLFFIFLPVNCVKTIKTEILKWIESKQPLTLL